MPTSGYARTAIQVDSIDGVEALSNTGGGPGYVYFRGNIDFSDIVSMTDINELRGSASDDTFNGSNLAETVFGFGGNDTIYGNGGNDMLYAGNGDDYLFGGSGADLLVGEAGNDYLHGGTGSDIFRFGVNQGTNIIADFVRGTDLIALDASVFGINLYDYSGSALLEFTDGTSATYVLLDGVATTSIDGSEFYWV